MRKISFFLLPCLLAYLPCQANTVYNETSSGDLSNGGLAPTVLTVTPGSNQVLGVTGSSASGLDRDYFTLTVPVGFQIGHIVELAGTQVGGAVSFFGLESGPQLTVPPNAGSAAGLLGWDHYSATSSDVDILSALRIPSAGSTGFSSLPSGQYSFWIQDFNAGPISYGFNIDITPTPEPATAACVLASLFSLAFVFRKRAGSKLS